MLKRYLTLFVILIFTSVFIADVCEAKSKSKNGSLAICRFEGNNEKFIKKIKSKEVEVFFDEFEESLELVIDGEAVLENEEVVLSLTVPVFDVPLLEAGSVYTSSNDEIEIEIDKFSEEKDLKIINLIEDENGDPIDSTATIKINKLKNNSLSGSLIINFPETLLIDDSDALVRKTLKNQEVEDMDSEEDIDEIDDEFDDEFADEFADEFDDDEENGIDNGGITVNCRLKNVSVDIE